MPVAATCKCGKSYQVKDEFAGKRVKCPTCGLMIDVPALAPASPAAASAAAAPRMSGRKMLFIAAGVNLGAIVLGALALTFLYLTERPDSYGAPSRAGAPSEGPTEPGPAGAPSAPAPGTPPAPQPGTPPAPSPQKPPAQPTPATPTPAKPPTTPATPPAKPPATPPAPPAAANVLVYKDDVNGAMLRVLPGSVLRFELPARFKTANHVAATLDDEEKALQDLGQDKEAEKRGLYVFKYKAAQVGTAQLVVTFSDTPPGQGKGETWKYAVRIKVREDAPPAGLVSPGPPPRPPAPAAPKPAPKG